MNQTHLILAYYHFGNLEDPREEVKRHKEFIAGRDITCRVYISEEGINGQMSASRQAAQEYMDWIHGRPEFADISFKLTEHHEHVFPKVAVKYRPELVALGAKVDLSKRGEYATPARWKELLENEPNKVLLDVRNDYEWKVGHFEGATLPACETFRDFSQYADQLKQTTDPKKTPVMMYCTGGIRCEIYSSILRSKGFETVYQLEGGVINYGMKQGSKHWLGKLFVFDDRLTVPIAEGDSTTISQCHHCGCSIDRYYNCANMDCNALFLSCPSCSERFQGCCCQACMGAERVRPYKLVNKPFRRWYHYFQETQKGKGGAKSN